MKKHLSKIIITTLILIAIASSMIFAGILTKVPTFKVQFLYNLGTENPVLAIMVEDAKIAVTDKLVEESIKERLGSTTKIDINGSVVTIDDVKHELVVFGDLNEDGKIDVLDALRILQIYINKTSLEGVDLLTANIANKDNNIDVLDALRILELYVGKSTEILAEEYTNDLEITNSTLGTNKIELEFNMPVASLAMAFDIADYEAAIKLYDDTKAAVTIDQIDIDSENENKAILTVTLTEGETYTVKVEEDLASGATEPVVLAEKEITYNPVELSDIELQDEEDKTISTLTRANEKINVVATISGDVGNTPSFTLLYEVFDTATPDKDEEPSYKDEEVVAAKIENGSLTIEDVNITSIPDGYLRITLKYVDADNYKAELVADIIRKHTTEIVVENVEIDRNEAGTALNLTIDLEEDIVGSVTGWALVVADGTTPTVEKIKDKGSAITATLATPSTLKVDLSVTSIEEGQKLFLILNDGIEDTEILGGYVLPLAEAQLVVDGLTVTLGDGSKDDIAVGTATWSSESKTGIAGYRVNLYKGADLIYTTTVSASVSKLDLIDEIKTEDVKSTDEFTVGVVALGDGVNYFNSTEAKSTPAVKFIELPKDKATVAFETDPANSTNLTITFAVADYAKVEDLTKVMNNVENLEIKLYNTEASDPTEPVEKVTVALPEVEEVKDDNGDVESYVYTIDLAKYMTDDGTWSVDVKAIAKKVSLYIDTELATSVEKYVKASIVSVETTTGHNAVTVTVKIPEGLTSPSVKGTYVSNGVSTSKMFTATNATTYTLTLDKLTKGTEYTLAVELIVNGGTADKEEGIKVQLAEKQTLTTDTALIKGTDFMVTDTKITFGADTYDRADIANADLLKAVYDMLETGDKIIVTEDGVSEITLAVTDDPVNTEVVTRTLTIDAAMLAEKTTIISIEPETLIIKGTANTISFVDFELVDIQALQSKVIDLSSPATLRLEGTEELDLTTIQDEDIITAPVTAFTNYKVEGYDHVFRMDYDGIISRYKSFIL